MTKTFLADVMMPTLSVVCNWMKFGLSSEKKKRKKRRHILQYFGRMKHSKNISLCKVFQCFKLSDEYIKLLTLYRCGSSDSVYCVKRCADSR